MQGTSLVRDISAGIQEGLRKGAPISPPPMVFCLGYVVSSPKPDRTVVVSNGLSGREEADDQESQIIAERLSAGKSLHLAENTVTDITGRSVVKGAQGA